MYDDEKYNAFKDDFGVWVIEIKEPQYPNQSDQ